MRNLLLIAAAATVLASCNPSSKSAGEAGAVKDASENAVSYVVDKSASSIRWEGAKITETVHYGQIALADGSLSVNDGNLDAGSFTIDMNTVTNEDLTDAEYNGKLIGHLKSADFFHTEAFPTAKFEITSVSPSTEAGATHSISGNLTIKDVTKGISFPASVNITDTELTANASFTINRNDWGVVWGGTLTDQSIKDYLQNNLIKDEIAFQIQLKANK